MRHTRLLQTGISRSAFHPLLSLAHRAIIGMGLLGFVSLLAVGSVSAQAGSGQICLSAFEDTNGNQLKDQGEAPITQNIVVTLADAQNVIVESKLLDNSPLASNGVICFQNLMAGQYTLSASSANYDPTTNTSFLTAVDASGTVQRFDYGGKVAISHVPAPTSANGVNMTPQRQSEIIERVLRSSVGAIIVISLLALLGVIVYWVGFRLPPRSRVARVTGQYPAVYAAPIAGQYTPNTPMRPIDPSTGQIRGVGAAPVPPIPAPPSSFDDTGPIRTVKPVDLPPAVPENQILPDELVPPASDDDTGRYRPPRE